MRQKDAIMHAVGRIAGPRAFRAFAAAALAALLFAASPALAIGTPTVSATAGDGEVTLSWRRVSEASAYQYRMSEDGGSTWQSWTSIDMQTGDTKTHTVTDLTNGTAYTFQVRGYRVAYDSSQGGFYPVYGEASDSVTATPTAPAE